MTIKEAKLLNKGNIIYDKKHGYPFIFEKVSIYYNGLHTSNELKTAKPNNNIVCTFVKGFNYNHDYNINSPFMYFELKEVRREKFMNKTAGQLLAEILLTKENEQNKEQLEIDFIKIRNEQLNVKKIESI